MTPFIKFAAIESVRIALKNRWTRRASLFLGMYAITATIIGIETGSVVTGLTLGLVGSTFKTAWAGIHGWMFGTSH